MTDHLSTEIALPRLGIWSSELRSASVDVRQEIAERLENMGFAMLWFPGGGRTALEIAQEILVATKTALVATGIASIWSFGAMGLGNGYEAIELMHPGRFLLGLGVSHESVVDAETPGRYQHPLAYMRSFLDSLDSQETPIPHDRIILAALGPQMLRLSAERSRGAHPYLVSPEHTAFARDILGPGPLLAPEQAVVLEADQDRAIEIARTHIARYLPLPNYARNWLRMGFAEEDFSGGGSDRLVRALVAFGSVEEIRDRIAKHFAAGADHVCVQVLGGSAESPAFDAWARLAEIAAL